MKKRVLSVLLALGLCLSLLPGGALAAAEEETPVPETGLTVTGGVEGTDYTLADGALTVLTDTPLTVSGTSSTEYIRAAGKTCYLTLDGLTLAAPEYKPAIRVEKNSMLFLSMGQDKVTPAETEEGKDTLTPAATLTGGLGRAGIEVPKGATLEIREGGTLDVTSGKDYNSMDPAAIGGSAKVSASDHNLYAEGVGRIEISGGTVKATGYGSDDGAGIGAGQNGSKNTGIGEIVIRGGHVIATGNPGIGADEGGGTYRTTGSVTITGGTVEASETGLGSGILAPGASITISGGTVNAEGYGVALGGADTTVTIRDNARVTVYGRGANGTAVGSKNGGGTVNIEGGTVDVTYGFNSATAVGIGGSQGKADHRTAVNISGGTVTATGSYGPGIGGDFCDVTISGGKVVAHGHCGGPGIGGNNYINNDRNRLYHGTVTITGGEVSAYGSTYNTTYYGAGIGTSGHNVAQGFGPDARITITGGSVFALGAIGRYEIAPGIGGGRYYDLTDKLTTCGGGEGWFSTGESGSAVIVANGIEDGFALEGEGWSGLVVLGDYVVPEDDLSLAHFVSREARVQGHPSLTESATISPTEGLTIPQGASLTLGEGKHLTVKLGELTNDGTIDVYGGLSAAGLLNNGVINWYGGTLSHTGGVVNYPSAVSVSAAPEREGYDLEETVTFTALVTPDSEKRGDVPLAAGGVVDFYLDDGAEPFDSVEATLTADMTRDLLAARTSVTVDGSWRLGKHTVTARYRDGAALTPAEPKARQLPGEGQVDFTVKDTVGEAAEALAKLTGGTPEEIRSAVRGMTGLKAALTHDGDGAVAQGLQTLEEKTGVTVAVASDGVFDEGEVSQVGAGLNPVTQADRVTLEIAPLSPEEEQASEIPADCNPAVTARFSMTLTGLAVDAAQTLPAPVAITLPVPETIDARYLKVLHYQGDGTAEEVRGARVSQRAGKWYVTFVVDHFSPFALAETQRDVTATLTGGAVRVDAPYNVRESASRLLAARYEAGRMAEVRLGSLGGDGAALFQVQPEAGWSLFLLDEHGAPVCNKVTVR